MNKTIALIAFLMMVPCFAFSQEVKVIKYNDLKKIENKLNDTTYVINFWATWCRPCVQELPYFDALTTKMEGQKIKVILVSLDFKRELDSKLVPFVKKNKLVSEVLLLDEPDYNEWIPKIDASWSGAIPATLIINNKNVVIKFFEQEFTEAEINKTVESLIY